jgi:hypothetical protein
LFIPLLVPGLRSPDGDLGAPDLDFAREAIDVGARAANQLAFHDGCTISGVGHVLGQLIARCAAAENEDVKLSG